MKLLFVGDTMFERKLKEMVLSSQNPLEHVAPVLKNYDYVCANLETVISEESAGIPLAHKVFRLKSPVESLDILKSANISIVNLANNHTMDFEQGALLEELRLLDQKGIMHFGAGKDIDDAFAPLILDTKDGRIAFLGFNRVETHRTKAGESSAGQAFFKQPARMEQAIRVAKKSADLVFVLPHWGKEYSTKVSEKQVYFGEKFIEWGADLVVGTHPHVVQESTIYQGKSIYYSLGNFCFSSGLLRPGILDGQALGVEIKNKAIANLHLREVHLEESGVPYFS